MGTFICWMSISCTLKHGCPSKITSLETILNYNWNQQEFDFNKLPKNQQIFLLDLITKIFFFVKSTFKNPMSSKPNFVGNFIFLQKTVLCDIVYICLILSCISYSKISNRKKISKKKFNK